VGSGRSASQLSTSQFESGIQAACSEAPCGSSSALPNRILPPPPKPPDSPANRPAPTRTPRPANTVAPLDHRLSCKDVASMFLGCSLLVSSFLLPLFVPHCPRSRHPRHAKTRALQPRLPPSAQAPIRSRRPASRQPTVATPNIETAAAWSRLQRPPPAIRAYPDSTTRRQPPKSEFRTPKPERRPKPRLVISGLGFRPSIGPRISGFGFGPLRSRFGGIVKYVPARRGTVRQPTGRRRSLHTPPIARDRPGIGALARPRAL